MDLGALHQGTLTDTETSLPIVLQWGWRGAPAPSNPRPGRAPPVSSRSHCTTGNVVKIRLTTSSSNATAEKRLSLSASPQFLDTPATFILQLGALLPTDRCSCGSEVSGTENVMAVSVCDAT